jgi:hypothetical protein
MNNTLEKIYNLQFVSTPELIEPPGIFTGVEAGLTLIDDPHYSLSLWHIRLQIEQFEQFLNARSKEHETD